MLHLFIYFPSLLWCEHMNTAFPTLMNTIFPTARSSGSAYLFRRDQHDVLLSPGIIRIQQLMYIRVPTDVHDWSVAVSTPVTRWQGVLEVYDGAATWHMAFKLLSPVYHRLKWWAAGYFGWGAPSRVRQRTVDTAVARMWTSRWYDPSQLQKAPEYWYLPSQLSIYN